MSTYSTVSRAYDSSTSNQKVLFRRAVSTMAELEVDFNDCLAKVMEVLGSPQFESISRSNPQLKTNVDSWQNELITSTVHFRERTAFLLQDLKYITSPLQADPVLKSRLDQACDSMNPISTSDISSRLTAQQYEVMAADKMNVLYPGYRFQKTVPPPLVSQPIAVPARSTTPPVTTRTAVYDQPPLIKDQSQAYRIDQHGNKVFMDLSGVSGQNRSPRPSAISGASVGPASPITSGKIYIIDPVTGERIEKRDVSPVQAPQGVTIIQPSQVD